MIISEGSWVITVGEPGGEPIRINADEVRVCELCGDVEKPGEERKGKASKQECIGNANLISRSPHLLRLAKQMQSLIRTGRLTGPECWMLERRAAALVDDFEVEER